MGGAEAPGARELDQTPTWAVSAVCAAIVMISIILEKVLHSTGEWFQERHKKALYEALEKVKAELMVLGFISLLLTFSQSYIAQICIEEDYAYTMLPCTKKVEEHHSASAHEEEHHRRLLWYDRRFLAGGHHVKGCQTGYLPLISLNGLHQLHIFIFFLAVFHVMYSAITMMLGRLKTRGWKEWEIENTKDHDAMNDPSRFRLTHETSFVKDHTNAWTRTPALFYFVCFFQQFFRSVTKADYLTMRHGFVSVHLTPSSKFDFQKYIKRSLEDDFKVVVGISPLLWASVVLFLLFNVHGWHAMFWFSVLPLFIILAVGTKLQAIITQMALEIQERHAVVQGIPLVQYEFGLKSCFNENFVLIYLRVALGVGAQFLCSYITLPLYALVTQMGSNMKRSIFDEQTSKALKEWHKKAVKKTHDGKPEHMTTRTLGGSPGDSPPPELMGDHPGDQEMADAEADHTANITATVDIKDDSQYDQRDLLS
ncbi:hypothetical protein MANES_18G003100v8 [Manihot esculenta]|uniref:Uncharacterized protein n=1 Tax=Manihot esculenta TaxID=3983 RepID=A0ACB7FX06_MANES|nr:hypothetical protein MANES_18G003100v8 [Manihot esculenta]